MMIKRLFILLILIAFAGTDGTAQDLRAEFAMARFDSPDDGPYLETYLKFKGNSLKMVTTEEGSYSEVIISYKIKKGIWVPFKDTYKVKGPMNKEGENVFDFIDQQRIPLKVGTYDLEIGIKDANDSIATEAHVRQKVVIEKKGRLVPDTASGFFGLAGGGYIANGMGGTHSSGGGGTTIKIFRSNYMISDIQLVDSYTKTEIPNILSKAGFDLVPYTSDYYPEGKEELTFYVEIYNTDEFFNSKYYHAPFLINKTKKSDKINKARGDEFLVNMFIENADNGKPIGSLRKFYKRKYAKVVPILHSFPLDMLPSGNYNLVVEIRDRENRILDSRQTFFQRSSSIEPSADYVLNEVGEENMLYGSFVSKYHDLDALEQYLRCLHPISNQQEISQVNEKLNFRDRNAMWRFMYDFWVKRNAEDPEKAWIAYWKEVEKVDASFTSNHKKGYDTDQGRVYLQYGPPNTISPFHIEAETYPYEIWHYYTLQDHLSSPQSNRKFIFANMSRGSKEFELLHSDATNETNNRHWNYDLHRRSNAIIDLNDEDGNDSFESQPNDFYRNPY